MGCHELLSYHNPAETLTACCETLHSRLCLCVCGRGGGELGQTTHPPAKTFTELLENVISRTPEIAFHSFTTYHFPLSSLPPSPHPTQTYKAMFAPSVAMDCIYSIYANELISSVLSHSFSFSLIVPIVCIGYKLKKPSLSYWSLLIIYVSSE